MGAVPPAPPAPPERRDGRRRGGAEAAPRRAGGPPAAGADREGYKSVYSELTRTDARLADPRRRPGHRRADDHLRPGRAAVRGVRGLGQVGDRQTPQQDDLDRRSSTSSGPTEPTRPSARPRRPARRRPAARQARIARLYIPELDKHWVVVEGVHPAGHPVRPGPLPDTAMPGQVGNFSVAGHRNRAIFWDLDQLKPGDPIVVETAQTWYVYQVSQNRDRLADRRSRWWRRCPTSPGRSRPRRCSR